ncbi:hypothetical protein PG996_012627 [Apiospora saccharicola]|uniref:Uncharacterized protein n=1 Tax=Apiospora saccharicola TaxID=335842 RepID=A0ABR1U350_9PEZI
MVSFEAIRASNAQISTALLPGLVAVFVGATSGIGETTLKQLAKRAPQPRIYFSAAAEPRAHVSHQSSERLIRAANTISSKPMSACSKMWTRSVAISVPASLPSTCYLSLAGLCYSESVSLTFPFSACSTWLIVSTPETDEGLHYPMALMYYARTRFIVNLLPLLRQAETLRRVVIVTAGGKEGAVFPADFQANRLGMLSFRPHATSMVTPSLLAIAKSAPEISFVHVYPSFVKTGMSRELTGFVSAITKVLFAPVMSMLQVPIDETGERQVYFATSARFPPRDARRGGSTDQSGSASGILLGPDVHTAIGADGRLGGGVYSIGYEAEGTSQRVQDLMRDLTGDDMAEQVWKHTEEEFVRITGSTAV